MGRGCGMDGVRAPCVGMGAGGGSVARPWSVSAHFWTTRGSGRGSGRGRGSGLSGSGSGSCSGSGSGRGSGVEVSWS
eukprot:12231830-Heterocapsa_arctica.AAC.1